MSLVSTYHSIARKALYKKAEEAVRIMKEEAPSFNGDLRASIRAEFVGDKVAYIEPHVKAKSNGFNYAVAAEKGRKAIVATNAPFLVFQTRDGRWHRVKRAKGYKGRRYVRYTAKKIKK